jgi:glycine oxidase
VSDSGLVVIGGGIIGLAVAWRLAHQGLRPRVLDAGSPGATRAAAGMLAPSFETASGPLADPLFAFSRQSLALWRDFAAELEAESGVTIDYRADGVLGVATNPAEGAALARRAERLSGLGVRVETLGSDDIARLEPSLAPGLQSGVFAPEDGQVDPRRVLTALQCALERRGVAIERFEVKRIDERSGRIVITETSGADLVAEKAILAAGSFAHKIAGARSPRGFRIFPVKGEALALQGAPLRHVVRSDGAYLCPKADGRTVIGATSLPNDETSEVDEARIAALRVRAEALCAALRALPEQERWSGLRPATEDGAPIIGPDPEGPESLFYALGHYRNGVLLAPATAAAIVRRLRSGIEGAETEAFRPRRTVHSQHD